MGKGDKRTTRGKTFAGSYGNARPKSAGAKSPVLPQAPVAAKKAPAKKAPAKKA
jgi:30S ribosomal protein S31